MKTLNVPHVQQSAPGLCLPACAQMALSYLGVVISLDELTKRLGAQAHIGTPYSRVTRLAEGLGVDVTFATGGVLADLRGALERSLPAIVFVQAGELPHWSGIVSPHAIVIAGMDDQAAQALDPALSSPNPISVPLGDLLLAWDEMGNAYAVLNRRSEKQRQ
jgi:ABC-type bacteriocin/lantibiotic exporter with double-glycine peptidase domain